MLYYNEQCSHPACRAIRFKELRLNEDSLSCYEDAPFLSRAGSNKYLLCYIITKRNLQVGMIFKKLFLITEMVMLQDTILNDLVSSFVS